MADKEKLTLVERITGRKASTAPLTEQQSIKESDNPIISGISFTKKELLRTDVSSLDERGLFELFNRMDEDSIVSSALDLLADNATIVSRKTGHVVAVESSDVTFKDEINDFLWNIINIDTEAWEYIRSVVKYGSVFLDTRASNGGKEWSFIESANPYLIKALTYGQDEVKYFVVEPEETNAEPKLGENPFYVARVNSMTVNSNDKRVLDADAYIAGFNSRKHLGKMTVKTTLASNDDGVEEELYVRTGRSVLASVISTWQNLTILEDQLMTYRLAKSNVFKLVQVNVEGSTNKQAEQIMKSVQDSFRSSETIDMTAGRYGNRQSPIPAHDFIYVPVKGAKGSVVVNEVGSEVGTIDLSDINYFRNKLFAGLGVLKAYLGWEESTPGGLGDSTLTKLDERMSKRVLRLQEVLKKIVKQIINYYWRYSKKDRSLDNIPEYDIILGEVSNAAGKEDREKVTANLDIADRFMAIADDPRFSDKVSNDKLFRYIFENILGVDLAHIDLSIKPEQVQIKQINKIPLHKKETIKESSKKKFGEDELEEAQKAKKKKFGESENFLEGTVKDLYFSTDIKQLIEEYDIVLISPYSNRRVPLSEALDLSNFKKLINEETYKSLKQLTKDKDPKRVEKSKKMTVKYKGLDDDNNILFQVTAEDPKSNAASGRPTSYETKLQLKDLAQLMADRKHGDKDANLVQKAMQGDIAVSCECPASKYWGQQYVGTKNGYSIVKNDIAPKRNLPTQVVCKHTLSMLAVAPFWWNTIVFDLRAKGVLKPFEEEEKEDLKKAEEPIKEEPVKEEPKAEEKIRQEEEKEELNQIEKPEETPDEDEEKEALKKQ